MIEGHERNELLARSRGDELVDRAALLGGTDLQLLGQTLGHADGQCAHFSRSKLSHRTAHLHAMTKAQTRSRISRSLAS
jgi:hypothetical protein